MPENDAARFLADKQPALVSYVNWGRQKLDFDVALYLSAELPSSGLVTSVRGIVLLEDRVVVMENEDGRHFMPRGRVEPGESFSDALEREIHEECGLTIDSAQLLGFLHFQHIQPAPINYPYPHPNMFHLVYSVIGSGELVQKDTDGYEFASHLYSVPDAYKLQDTEPAHPFLEQSARRLT